MDKKELKEERDYFGSWFEGRGSIMVQEQIDGAVAAAGWDVISSQEEERDSVWLYTELLHPSLARPQLPKAAQPFQNSITSWETSIAHSKCNHFSQPWGALFFSSI